LKSPARRKSGGSEVGLFAPRAGTKAEADPGGSVVDLQILRHECVDVAQVESQYAAAAVRIARNQIGAPSPSNLQLPIASGLSQSSPQRGGDRRIAAVFDFEDLPVLRIQQTVSAAAALHNGPGIRADAALAGMFASAKIAAAAMTT